MSDFPNIFDTIEPLLDSDQAAAIVKVNKKTLQRHARNGLVVGLRVGKLWRFRASDLIPTSAYDQDERGEDLDDDAQAQ
jgi:phage terminase Nu1 subunit (DNA packaging protein)